VKVSELVRRFEREKRLAADEVPDMYAFALLLGGFAEQRHVLKPDLDLAKGKRRSAALGGKNKDKVHKTARDEARDFEAFRAKHPQLSREACARLFPRGPGRTGGRSLLRRVARAKKAGPPS
jgi:hypothetical protein